MRHLAAAQRRFCVLCLIALGHTTCPALAEDWSDFFDATSHDFGTVARGQPLRHTFRVTNKLDEPIHISSATQGSTRLVQVTRLDKDWLDPGESVDLKIRFNTLGFSGRRSVSISVVFDRPTFHQVRLVVGCFSRSDLVVTPGEIDFNSLPSGKAATRTVKIEYAGDLSWTIASAACKNPHLKVQLEETHREQAEKGYATVGYELEVSIREDTPAGKINDSIVLEINDRSSKTVDIFVNGIVEAEPDSRVTGARH